MNRPSFGENNFIAVSRPIISKRKSFFGLGLLSAGLALALTAGRAEATNYYVSPLGNNTTGTSYGTAFTELNKIKWSLIKPYDVIYIDGGQSQTTYVTTMTVPASATQVSVGHTTDVGHTGTVVIDGSANSSGIGINILSNNFGLYGQVNKTQGIVLQNFSNCGVRIDQPAGSFITVNGVLFKSDVIGINAVQCQPNIPSNGNTTSTVQSCNFQDCTNAGVRVASTAQADVNLCWFHGTVAPTSSQTQTGILGGAGVSKSVFGPQLNYGIIVQNNGNPCYVFNSLFLDAYKSNFSFGTPPVGNNGYQICNLTNVTAVSTSLNPNNVGHNTIVASSGQISQSIFLGAKVNAAAGVRFYSNQQNDQYNITGNTTALAATQIDPQFDNPAIYTFPYNVSPTTLINTDYSTKATGFGSSVTSVSNLQQLQFQ